jgi:hypothetical protein
MLAPVNMLSGGVIPSLCPLGAPTAAELNSKNPAIAAAAKIQKEEAEAKARRAAVRYLGTVPCHYFPEAEKALKSALREDRNECVRWEAAMALGSGCCCTKVTIQALADAISSNPKDSNPVELSERVKAAAELSLQHCLECYREIVPAKTGPERTKPPEGGTPPPPMADANVKQTAFEEQLQNKPSAEVIENARRVLAEATKAPATTSTLPTGSRSISQIFANASSAAHRSQPMLAEDHPIPEPPRIVAAPPKPPEPEPPADLYHILLARRKARQEAKAKMEMVMVDPVPVETKVVIEAPTAMPEPTSSPAALAAPTARPSDTTTKGGLAPASATIPPALERKGTASLNNPVSQKTTSPAPGCNTLSQSMSQSASPVVQTAYAYPVPGSPQARHTGVNVPTAKKLVTILGESYDPFQREWAVHQLAAVSWPADVDVVAALQRSASKDPAAVVRVQCLRCLAQRNVNTPAVIKTIRDMKADVDPRVRHEADQALVSLGATAYVPSGQSPGVYWGQLPGRSN